MHKTSRRLLTGFLSCLTIGLGTPAGVLGAEAPAPAPAPVPAPPAPPADPTAVLKIIPADATAFLAVRNLRELDAEILAITEKLGLPLAAIGFPGPLEFVKQNAGITEGLNDNAGLAFALLSCAEVEMVGEMTSRLVVLIPCSDLDALVGPMGAEKEGDLITLQLLGQPSVAAAKDGFLVVGQNTKAVEDVLRAKGGGIITTMSPDRLEAFQSQDVFGWASPRGISQAIRDEISDTFKGLMFAANPMMAQAQTETTTEQLAQFLDELSEITFGLTVDQKVGVKLGFYYRMKPDTQYGGQLAAMRVPDGPLLVGLPDEPVVLAMGSTGASGNPLYEKQMRQTMDQVVNEDVIGGQVDVAKLKSLTESLVQFIMALEQMSFSVAALPSEGEDGLVGLAFVAKVADSQRTQAELRNLFDTGKALLIEAAQEETDLTEDEANAVDEAIQWKASAEKLAGAAVDHFVVDLAKLPDVDPDKIDQIKSVIGQEGVLLRVAAVGDKHVAVTFGGGAKRFAQIVDLIQKGQAPLAEKKTIKMVGDRLPARGRVTEVYFSIDRLLALIMNVANRLDQPLPLPLIMKETAPIGMTMAKVDNTAVQGDLLIPIELAQSAMEMAQPFIQMMLMGTGTGMPGEPVPGTMPGGQPMPFPMPAPAPEGGPK